MSEYKPNELVKKFIEEKDLQGVREAVGTIIYEDRTFKNGSFDSAVKFMKNRFPNDFMEKFNPQPPLISEAKKAPIPVNDEDFAVSVSHLKRNFCDERIDDVKAISKRLYGTQSKATSPSVAARTPEKSRAVNSTSHKNVDVSKNAHCRLAPVLAGIVGLAALITIIVLIVNAIRK